MPDWTMVPINPSDHALEVLDLVQRAADYVTLEVSRAPDVSFVKDFFEATPPGVSQDDLKAYGIRQNEKLIGIAGVAPGYEFPVDWWLGLLLLDPAVRGQGIGTEVVSHLIDTARSAGVITIKLSVLKANPRGLRFWKALGFEFHRPAPALAGSDGHDRIVLKYRTRKERP